MGWLDKISPRIHHGGYRRFSEGIINPWRIISDHEYFVFEGGYGDLVIDGRTYSCLERSYIIIPSGKRHISYAYSKDILLHWAHFDWVPGEYPHSAQTFMEPAVPEHALSTDGYSYSRQERIFREVFGLTPHQYVTSLRVERIRHLLNESTLTISDISDKMGFKDPAYFSRFVTKHFGMPPRDLRK